MKKNRTKIDGWLIIDKPEGITSAKLVNQAKKIFNAEKVGHGGTLDPFASGILPLAFGEATKTMQFVTDYSKQYKFMVCFGESRDTDDREGKVLESGGRVPSKEEILAALPSFIGNIEQTPPQYSAIKINGERAYDLARSGQQVDIKSRIVTVRSLEPLSYTSPSFPGLATLRTGNPVLDAGLDSRLRGNDKEGYEKVGHVEFRMTCEKGTYVRSIARDLAYKLGTYAYVSSLRREAVGKFSENMAISLEKLERIVHIAPSENDFGNCLLPVETVLDDIPVLNLEPDNCLKIRQGQSIKIAHPEGKLRIVSQGKLVAIGEIESGMLKPVRVFNIR